MGNTHENPKKDYYINMGSKDGLSKGTVLEIIRKMPTYDVVSQQLYQDMSFPIARVKVIHVEPTGSVARLEKMLSFEQTPVFSPHSIMVGDVVRPIN